MDRAVRRSDTVAGNHARRKTSTMSGVRDAASELARGNSKSRFVRIKPW